jgi:mycothiol synthase
MRILQARSYTGEADLQPVTDFLNLCEAYDKLDEGISVDELRDEFNAPTLDTARDLRIWEDGDGAMIGFGQLWISTTGDPVDGYLWFKVHPEHRDGMIASEIIAWGEERMREVGREHSVRTLLRSGARSDRADEIALLEEHGFAIGRYFLRMTRSLHEPIPEPVLPSGFTIRTVVGTHQAAAWIDMFNQSFIDHWNHHDKTVEERLHWMSESYYNADRDLIVVAPDGTFAAFAFCSISSEENTRTGRKEGWVNLLGTRRGFRKIGLGRAILLAGLQRLQADGMDTALLGVDADSLTGATRLYQSVGFKPVLTFVGYVKDV